MHSLRSVLMFSAAVLVGAFWAPPAQSFSYVMPSDESLYLQSEGVVVAQVIEELDPAFDSRLPQRRWRLDVERVLAGLPLKGEVVLRLPGTRDDAQKRLFLPGVPTLQPGERILAFYTGGPDGELRPIQLSLGLFFETTLDQGKRGYVRLLDDAIGFPGKAANQAYHLPRDAERFESWIAQGARGAAFSYLTPSVGKSATRDAKFSLIRDAAGVPVRWFAFDSGDSVPWQAVVGQPVGSTFNPDSAVVNAQNAWNAIPASRINLAYNMARVASDPGNDLRDGINAVIWDDPGNDIPGTFDQANCLDGVLGVGGQFYFPTTRTFDGTDYHEAVEGFLILQDGAGCFFSGASGQARATEVLTHEFGHTLGFGHTCSEPGLPSCSTNPVLNDATMRGQIHDDGRAGAVRTDDIFATKRVYPSPTYIHPRELLVSSPTADLAGCTGAGSRDASSSADGSVIIFQTTCTVPGKAGGVDAIMVQRRDDCAKQLGTKASDPRCDERNWMRHTKGAPLGQGIEPSITADGRFAVFVSDQVLATKSLPSDKRIKRTKQSAWVIYMRNVLTNATYSVTTGMNVGVGTQPQVSPDGTAISFVTTTLPENGPGEIPDATPDVFQIKPEFGFGGDPEMFGEPICASCKDAPGEPAGPPASSANGVFLTYSLGNTSGGGGGASLWLRNMVQGSTNQMVPPTGGAVSMTPSIDYTGNTIVFTSTAAINTADGDNDTNGKEDVFFYQACCNKFTRVSKPDVELPNPALQEPSMSPTISGDGRRIAFLSRAQNLMGYTPDPADNNIHRNLYAYDIQQRIKRRYSRNPSGQQSNGDSDRPFMNYTGSVILFDTAANNFDPSDSNGVQDVVQLPNPQAEFVVFGSGFD